MALLDELVGFFDPYAIYIAAALLVLGILAAIKTGFSGGTTAGLLWLAILFVLVGIYLVLAGNWEDGLAVVLVGALLGFADSLHERRLTRRDHARMRD